MYTEMQMQNVPKQGDEQRGQRKTEVNRVPLRDE